MKNVLFVSAIFLINLTALVYSIQYAKTSSYTGSMEPTIHGGEVVFYANSLPQNLTGQIIIFNVDGMNIGHRVIEDHGKYLVTKGDANPVRDPRNITRSDITGIVTSHIPFPLYSAILVVISSALTLSGIFLVAEVREK